MGKLQTTIVAGGRLDCKHSLAVKSAFSDVYSRRPGDHLESL